MLMNGKMLKIRGNILIWNNAFSLCGLQDSLPSQRMTGYLLYDKFLSLLQDVPFGCGSVR